MKVLAIMGVLAIAAGGITACTSSSVELREGGKMSFTYESPALRTDAKEAFSKAQNDMRAICKLAGGENVEFPVERPSIEIEQEATSIVDDIIIGASKDILRDLSGRTTVRLDGTCVGYPAAENG